MRSVFFYLVVFAIIGASANAYDWTTNPGDGTPENPYQISTPEQLMAISYGMNEKCYVLTNDIIFDPNNNPEHIFTEAIVPFIDAIFDGNDFSIKNVKIIGIDSNTDGVYENNNLGLFRSIGNHGKVKNLTVDHISIQGNDYLGGLTSKNMEGTIVNCSVSGNIQGGHEAEYIGGIAGYNQGAVISNCFINTEITAGNQARFIGGVTGVSTDSITYSDSLITGCRLDTAILTPADSVWVGGIAGENQSPIEGCHGKVNIQAGHMVGGIAGRNVWVNILQCSTSGTVIAQSRGGGCVGQNLSGLIAFCSSTADVSCQEDAGGLIGNENGGTCYSSFTQSQVSGTNTIGGFIGSVESGHILNCFAGGHVQGTSNVGGFAGSSGIGCDISFCYSLTDVQGANAGGFTGREYGGVINDCFWNKEIQSYGIQQSVGNFIFGYTRNLNGLTTTQMQRKETYINSAWDFVNETANGVIEYWAMVEPNQYPVLTSFHDYAPVLPEGQGTPEAPFLISSVFHLSGIPHFPSACYQLTEDLDLADYNWVTAAIPYFNGIFNGQNHTIYNVSLRGGGHLGFWGTIGFGGCIQDIHFKQSDVTTFHEGSFNCGMLAGVNYGTVIGCTSISNVIGGYNCGGLIGTNEGGMSRCSSQGAVQGFYCVGGLIGNSYDSEAVDQCYSHSSVTAALDCVGGLIGSATCDVQNSYAKGQVIGEDKVGGFIGRYENKYREITNCYSTGTVSGISEIGGFLGNNSSEDIVGCYFLDTAGPDNGYGIPLDDPNMMMQSNFLSWDFVGEDVNGSNDVWRMCVDGVADPRLSWEFARGGDFACGDGVDLGDLEALAECWLLSETITPAAFSTACDANGDGVIDLADFAVLSGNWP